jgi:hypothetical protein
VSWILSLAIYRWRRFDEIEMVHEHPLPAQSQS